MTAAWSSDISAPRSGARRLARGTRFLRTPGIETKRVPLANFPAPLRGASGSFSGMDDERHFRQTKMKISRPTDTDAARCHHMKSDSVREREILVGIVANDC